jgi:hypothetical protein
MGKFAISIVKKKERKNFNPIGKKKFYFHGESGNKK